MKNWYALSIKNIFEDLKTNEHGLTTVEAEFRQKKFGFNALPAEKSDSILKIFINQFKSPLIYILLICSLVVILLGEVSDGLIVLGVLFFNSIIGTIQEGKAQNTLLALKNFTETSTTVVRDGKEFIIPDKELVPGDIVIIQEGEKIPADARIISSNNLKIDEASITGESVPLFKDNDEILDENLPVHSQKNMVFKGTNVASGNAKVVIVLTGVKTYIGKIAKQISKIDTDIPLKAEVKKLSQGLIYVVGVVSVCIFLYGIFNGYTFTNIFITVVSLAVSAIPEGLPIVITLVLASGVWRMSKKNVLVKKLQAVEALGQATVIAVDKTGTITKNELIVSKVWINGKMYEISGSGYESTGAITPSIDEELLDFARISTLSSGARISFDEKNKVWKVTGDPTEAAMLVFGEKAGFNRDDLKNEIKITSENPFDFKLKHHSFHYDHNGQNNFAVIGAPEAVFSICNLSDVERLNLEKVFLDLSEEGLRVIAIAKNKVFKGFLAMKDTLRPEVFDSMKKSRQAGIKVVMITGDHKITARSIAREAGIFVEGDDIITGEELDSLSDEEVVSRLEKVSVFARVTPENKSKIIRLYKMKGEIIAMTGDGVNDAPSLVTADLGVGMGKIGTEVAKEASDIVLMDDNFGSIISAVEEGRGIYKTIKRVILYLFSTSAGEMLTIIVALFVLDYPLPILAAQIIWLNLVTDGFLDVALAMEPKQKNLLANTSNRKKRSLFDRLMVTRMIFMAVPMMVGTLIFFGQYFEHDIEKAWTISLTILAMFQWFNAWNCRSETKSIFTMNPFSNIYLILATLVVVGLQIFAVYNPFMQGILKTVPLTFDEWMMMIPVAMSVIVVEEIRKISYKIFFYKKRRLHSPSSL